MEKMNSKENYMNNFENNKVYFGFRLTEKTYVEDIKSMCHVFVHEKSGAKLFYAQNDDKNKVFFISYKTPPENDCGTAHIMEHSVLCGSEKYPVKDPFNELEKGSLNTYLNALTYSDKTVYPVASCNDKDFENLVRVYADAVFAPNVLKERKIFEQEGWHYELESKDDELKLNGVVYNEMKGALSQPERVLGNVASKSLFGDTVYGYESGGDPESIPDLTYKGFKDFYNKFYYPSNSFIYLYGDMDLEKYLSLLSDEYLNKFENNKGTAVIDEVKETKYKYLEGEYSVLKREENDSYFSLNYCTGKSTDILLQFGMEVLTYILFETNSSPIKKAAVESGLCTDLEGWFDNSTYQMTLSIVGKKCRYEDREKFKKLITDVLKETAEKGIEKDLCRSAINYLEFVLREADFGYKPKGLAYGMRMMYGWLNGKNPIESIKMWDYFEVLREGIENGYFENLIKEYILNNSHSSFTVIRAKEGLQAESDKKLGEKLRAKKDSLSEKEIEKIVADTKALREYQDSDEKEEDLNKIPFVSINEIEKKAELLKTNITEYGIETIGSTNDIEYIKLLFNMDKIPQSNIPYASLLARIIGRLDTNKYSYDRLPAEIDMYTGGIYSSIDIYEENGSVKPFLSVNGKALERNADKLFELLRSVTSELDFTKTESLQKIIRELKMRIEHTISENGHLYSAVRALSYVRSASAYKEICMGMAFKDFMDNVDKDSEKTAEILKETADMLFTNDNVTLIRLSENGADKKSEKRFNEFKNILPEGKGKIYGFDFKPRIIKEGITNSSKIVYNSMGADFNKFGFSYSGAMNVVKNIINTEYLWNQVRVKGGAYGSGCTMMRNGSVYTYSYRDPNCVPTYKIYGEIGNFLRGFAKKDIDISKFILGAVNEIDRPKSNSDIIEIASARYMQSITDEMVQKSRYELLGSGKKDILNCADMFDKMIKNAASVTLGNENIINSDIEYFDTIRHFTKGE